MPLTNAERQQRFKQRKIAQLGIDEYNRLQREKFKTIRENKKNNNNILNSNDDLDFGYLPPIKIRPHNIIKSNLKDNTKDIYIKFIKEFYKFYTNSDLNDDNDIIKCINNQKYNSKNIKHDFAFVNQQQIFNDIIKTFIKRIYLVYSIFSRVSGFASFIKKLYPYQEKLQEYYLQKRQSKTYDKDIFDTISFDKDDVLKRVNDNINPRFRYPNKIIYLLTMLLPPRRISEYINTKISNTKPNNNNDPSYNYYHDGIIYIFNAKSDTRTVSQKQKSNIIYQIILPKEIVDAIDTNNEYLLGHKYSTNSASILFQNTFYYIYGHSITMSDLRRFYITKLQQDVNKTNYNSKQNVANAMNHSLEQQQKYIIPNKNID